MSLPHFPKASAQAPESPVSRTLQIIQFNEKNIRRLNIPLKKRLIGRPTLIHRADSTCAILTYLTGHNSRVLRCSLTRPVY